MDRRNLLKKSLMLATSSVMLKKSGGETRAAASNSAPIEVPGANPGKLGTRSPFETLERKIGVAAPSGYSFTPLGKLSGIITPSDLHFERHHAGVPKVDPEKYKLLIHGLVKRPLKFTLDNLKRFPSVSRFYFVECSGNGYFSGINQSDIPTEITPDYLDGLFSVSEWTGVLLSTLFKEAGVSARATWFLAESLDAVKMARSIPVRKGWDDAMIAYAQNGEPIRPEQGYPVRLLLPGWEGSTSVKWLRRIEVSDAPFMTREETSKYTDAKIDGRIEMFTFTMGPKSLITFPSYPTVLPENGWWEISGLAWSGNGKIKSVEVSTDGGNKWYQASLQKPVLSKCGTRFRFLWYWDGRETMIMSRAIDNTGARQPSIPEFFAERGIGTYYHNNVIRPWNIDKNGRVTFGLKSVV